jgi:hypothetical protein
MHILNLRSDAAAGEEYILIHKNITVVDMRIDESGYIA